jgi:mannose-6-phosphate isomerase-like protein (cupin superfamily)
VVRGSRQGQVDDNDVTLHQGDYVDIPLKAWHRIENPATSRSSSSRVQHGSYFGRRTTIERRSDDYGRA